MDPKPLDALRIDRSQAPPRSSGGGWLVVLAVVLAAAVAAWWFFTRPAADPVRTAVVEARPAAGNGGRTLLNASGYVTTRLEATVSSKVTGKVVEILVEEGMKVEKDQVLARLDAANVESGLRLAEARLASARTTLAEIEPMVEFTTTELERLTGLGAGRAVSASELSRARAEAATQTARRERLAAEVAVAERQVEDWRQQLDDMEIRAPFAGVVTTKDSQPGEMISPMSAGGGFTRTGICTLVDMDSLEIEVDVGESFINRVKAGQPVEATLDAYPDWKIPARVLAIIPTADRQKATVKVRVAFEKLDPRILPQMGVKVAFQSTEAPAAAGAGALVVPAAAIVQRDGRDVAWVLRGGKVERRAVTVGSAAGGEIPVLAGLEAGERVVLAPPSDLADGAAVAVESGP